VNAYIRKLFFAYRCAIIYSWRSGYTSNYEKHQISVVEGTIMKRVICALIAMMLLFGLAHAESADDLSIITKSGHPTFYGATDTAHAVWDGADSGKVLFADGFDRFESGHTIIYMDGDKREGYIIDSLEVYFQNCTPSVQLTIDDALPIAAEYFPYDIVAQWYEFDKSYYQAADDPDDDSYYVCVYHLTEAGSDAYYAKQHSYNGQMIIIFYVNPEGYVDLFRYTWNIPNGINYSGEEWNFDFNQIVTAD